jgi:hypothetical protein
VKLLLVLVGSAWASSGAYSSPLLDLVLDDANICVDLGESDLDYSQQPCQRQG